jgi:hypothetical protein
MKARIRFQTMSAGIAARKKVNLGSCLANTMSITIILLIFCNCRTMVSYPLFYQDETTIQFPPKCIILSQSSVGFLSSVGTLAAWQLEQGSLKKIWSLNTPYYRELLSEDIDGDGKKEIVALGSSLISEQNLAYGRYFKNKYFLDIYKERIPIRPNDQIAWLSTYQDSPINNIVEEEDDPTTRGMFIADLGEDGGREVVYATSHWIGVYKYIQETKKGALIGHLDKILAFQPSLPHENLHIEAISILAEQGDIKMIVSANVEAIKGGIFPLKQIERAGYVLIYNYEKDRHKFVLMTAIRVDAFLCSYLKVANLDDDISPEIIAVGYRKEHDAYDHFLYVFKNMGPKWTRFEYPIGLRSYLGPSIVIGLGRINTKDNKNEIVVSQTGIMQIDIFEWKDALINRLSKNLAENDIYLSPGQIVITDINDDKENEIVIAGLGRVNPDNGDLFLGVYDQKLQNKVKIIGGGRSEMRIRAITIMD